MSYRQLSRQFVVRGEIAPRGLPHCNGGWNGSRQGRAGRQHRAKSWGSCPGPSSFPVNGRELADFLDWEFLTADDELVIEARLPDGEEIVYEIERPEGEAHGRRARAAHDPPLR